jgi:D-glucosaminate-6-phosphate ammonia-lyase
MDVYDDLGVRKVINGLATVTVLGGSLMPPEVLAAMAQAARHFVDIDELQEKAGARIAAWTRNEAAYVSCGAAAGLVLATAACIAGTDPAKRERLPFTDGMRNEVIVHRKGRVGYDFAIRQAGGRLVEIGTDDGAMVEELEGAISDRTAAIFYFWNETRMPGQVPIETAIAAGRRRSVPVIVDAAAQIPPAENLWRFTALGAEGVLFSGGKGLRGPQASGLVLGTKRLVDGCAFNACPRAFIGRPMKAGKEEIVGLMTALRLYLDQDHEAVMRSWEAQVSRVIDAMAGLPGVTARRDFPSEAGQPMPRAEIVLADSAGLDRDALLRRLRRGEPSIAQAGAGERGVYVNPQTLEPGEEEIVARRIVEELRAARGARA